MDRAKPGPRAPQRPDGGLSLLDGNDLCTWDGCAARTYSDTDLVMMEAGLVRRVCIRGHSRHYRVSVPSMMARTVNGHDVRYSARPCHQCGRELGDVTHGNQRLHRACIPAANAARRASHSRRRRRA